MGQTTGSNASIEDGSIVFSSSVKAGPVIAHLSLNATAETGTVLLTPATYAAAGARPIRLSGAVTRVLVRARYAVGTTTITTSPVVRLYAVYDPQKLIGLDGVIPNDGSVWIVRIDNPIANAAGIGLNLPVNAIRDSVYRYSDFTDAAGYDLLGASHLLVLTETAGVVSGGANTTIECQVMLVN